VSIAHKMQLGPLLQTLLKIGKHGLKSVNFDKLVDNQLSSFLYRIELQTFCMLIEIKAYKRVRNGMFDAMSCSPK